MEKQKELWGRRFRIVKNGLDEADVISYVSGLQYSTGEIERKLSRIDSLITQLTGRYPELVESDGHPADSADLQQAYPTVAGPGSRTHVESLRRLAENTVIEADRQAEQMMIEAQERAQAESERIIDEARQRAEHILLDAKDQAEHELLAVKRAVEQVLTRSRALLEAEVKGMFDQASRQLLEDAAGIDFSTDDPDGAGPTEPADAPDGGNPHHSALELAIAPMTLYSH